MFPLFNSYATFLCQNFRFRRAIAFNSATALIDLLKRAIYRPRKSQI